MLDRGTVVALALCISAVMALPRLGAQSATVDPVARHRAVYQATERQLPRLRHAAASMDTLGLDRESTDGGLLTAYCAGDTVRLLVVDYYGESGDATSRFYFDGDSLRFVLEESRRGQPRAGVPYPERTIVTQDRYYFAGGHVIRWLDDKRRMRDVRAKDAVDYGTQLLTSAMKYRAKMPGCRPQYDTSPE